MDLQQLFGFMKISCMVYVLNLDLKKIILQTLFKVFLFMPRKPFRYANKIAGDLLLHLVTCKVKQSGTNIFSFT